MERRALGRLTRKELLELLIAQETSAELGSAHHAVRPEAPSLEKLYDEL